MPKRTLLSAAFAAILSFGVLFVTLLVSMHELGARDDISYINGGKVFRQTGTMWYHLPGLQEIGLAPQNIGARINLRNNEFAMLDRELRSVDRVDVDFALAPEALLLIILDRHREGTFTAVRLTAFADEESPFVNAIVRYEKGRVVDRVPLTDLGRSLSPGKHQASVVLDPAGKIVVSVDGQEQGVPWVIHTIEPSLALGCGERNTTIFRWAVEGIGEDGQPAQWEEAFEMGRSFDRFSGPIFALAALLWGLFFGLPILKVWLESGASPLSLLIAGLWDPWPRRIFGAAALVPLFPMWVHWILGGLFVAYAWMSWWDVLAKSRKTWRVPASDRAQAEPLGWFAATVLAIAIGAGLLLVRDAQHNGLIGEIVATTNSAETHRAPEFGPLALGERMELSLGEQGLHGARVSARINLGEKQAARIDLLRSAPPERSDVYQVDRSQDPGSADNEEGPTLAEVEGPSEYKFVAVSVVISTDDQLPGHLRRLQADKLFPSPHSGWMVKPGEHEVVVTVADGIAEVTVNGTRVDLRSDLPRSLTTGAVQILSMSSAIDGAGDIRAGPAAADALDRVPETLWIADVMGMMGVVFVCVGFTLLLLLAGTRLPFDQGRLAAAIRKGLRAHTLVLAWLVVWGLQRAGFVQWNDSIGQMTWAGVAVLAAGFNATQILRQTAPSPGLGRRIAGWMATLLLVGGSFEGMSHLHPEWRHDFTHYWNHQLGARYYFEHDPMIRRLNPWFIDQRFKRRDFTAAHPDQVRVVVFGGSQTYGWGIPAMDRQAFSDQLERSLHARGHTQVQVLNAAFPGVKTATGLRWFGSNLLRYQPDIVVINFVVNEFMNVDQYHVWSGERGPDDRVSRLATAALPEWWRGRVMGNHLSQIIVADVYEIYAMEQTLRWWVTFAREHNVRLVFSIEPTNLYVESGGKAIMREETQIGGAQGVYRKVGREMNVPVYDVLPHFLKEQENMWFYDTMHMSRLGHKVFAEHLAATIEKRHLHNGARTE